METYSSSSDKPSAASNGNEVASKVELIAKWNGKEYLLNLDDTATLLDLKEELCKCTNVHPKRQKLVGLYSASASKGKETAEFETTPLSALAIPTKKKFMLVGTPEAEIFQELKPEEMPDVVNDFDYDASADAVHIKNNIDNRNKLANRIKNIDVTVINPPRKGKKLLVLDIDYTILDMKSLEKAKSVEEMKRPFLDEFLTVAFKKYDIAVWSQTNWKWLEMKLTEMGMLTSDKYYVSFVLDRTSMFRITTKTSDGKEHSHEIKALEFIWAKLPQYNSKNTIHIDDLRRNFAFNPQNGLKIRAFKDALQIRDKDQELLHLSKYLDMIGDMEDLSSLNHKDWKRMIGLKRWKN